MNRFQKTITILSALILIAFLITAALKKEQPMASETISEQATGEPEGAPMGKVVASDKADGEYYVYITSVNQNPEDTTLTMKHVTYFEGPEARVSAANEVVCQEEIENCVPTLRAGYYVRESGASSFTAPLAKSAAIGASIAAQVTKDSKTVYIVTIKEGNVVRVMQVTK